MKREHASVIVYLRWHVSDPRLVNVPSENNFNMSGHTTKPYWRTVENKREGGKGVVGHQLSESAEECHGHGEGSKRDII